MWERVKIQKLLYGLSYLNPWLTNVQIVDLFIIVNLKGLQYQPND